MTPFDYARPSTVAEALALWEPGAAFLAGGTNLVDLMKLGVMQPGRIIDVTRIAALDGTEWLSDGGVRIGALVRNSDLAHDADVAARFPMMAEALLAGASGQLRNAATVGGNLMQRTRCAYFQDPLSACNRREPGTGCAAWGGAADALAILGWSEACVATAPSDFCVPLAALDAVVEVEGPEGVRDIPIANFHRLPGDRPEREFALEPNELIIALRVPGTAAQFSAHSRYLKVRERTSYAFALISAAACLHLEGGVIAAGRLALGAVAAKAWRVRAAEELMVGHPPEPALFAQVADAALDGARPVEGNGWKIELARRTAAAALARAAAGTPERLPALPASCFGEIAHA